MSRNDNTSDNVPGCLIFLFLGVVALPLVGLYIGLTGRGQDEKAIGWTLFILGCLFWLFALCNR